MTSCHATPRMATDGCALRVGTCDSGTEAAVGEVASCAPSSFCGPLAFRAAVEVQSSDVFQRTTASVSAQPFSRGCCRRCHGRGEEVGSSESYSASVSSLETKTLLSDWSLPKGCRIRGLQLPSTSQSPTPGESGGDSQPPAKDRSLRSWLSRRLSDGSSKVRNFNGVQFWSSSLVARTKVR